MRTKPYRSITLVNFALGKKTGGPEIWLLTHSEMCSKEREKDAYLGLAKDKRNRVTASVL